jgi:phospholipid-binding lipoprotein MlaA
VVPLLPPLDARDAIGYDADSLMDPLSIFVTPVFADLGRAAAKTINERAHNLKLYQDAEDSSLDLYAAVRNGYLQRRETAVEEADQDRAHPESFVRR